MSKLSKQTQIRLLRLITHIGALIPLALLLWDYQTNNLGADPVREITLRTGKITLILLFLSLACTPFSILGWKQATAVRRALGLYGFFYVCLHFLTFIWLDYLFNLKFIYQGILEQRYVVVGFIAFLLLIPLAATSNKWAMRKLGKKWKKLHKLVYLIAILGVVHFLWLGKVITEPVIFGAILFILLLFRLKPVKLRVGRWQREIRRRIEQRFQPVS